VVKHAAIKSVRLKRHVRSRIEIYKVSNLFKKKDDVRELPGAPEEEE
jgi:hypothetical protein